MQKQFVIDKITKQVLRYGFCDFTNDGNFLSEIEEIVESNAVLEGDETPWYWNSATQEFQQAPI